MNKRELQTIKRVNKYIDNGVKFLNKHKGKWWNRISIRRLDLKSGVSCVCGQLFTYHFDGFMAEYEMSDNQMMLHGFISKQMNYETYDLLTQLWHDRIKKIRAKNKKSK